MVFGRDTGFAASLNLADLDGNNGFVINGIDANDRSGRSVSAAGDINGDGLDDLIIGAPLLTQMVLTGPVRAMWCLVGMGALPPASI